MDSGIRDQILGKKITDLEERVEKLEGKEKPKSVEEKPIWSNDGICLGEVKEFWALNEKVKVHRCFTVQKGYEDNAFKTKERAELERDRREADYIMKKMACIRRKDKSWKKDKFNLWVINFYDDFETSETSDNYVIRFNKAYFHKSEHAQECIDFLLEKYTKARLKIIWGAK